MSATLSCIVIDDEKLYLRLLEEYVKKTPFLQLIKSFDNAVDAIPIIDEVQIDVVITDVRMPQLTGTQFGQIVNGRSMLILCSSFEEHAVTGFEINAIDYLLKPFTYDRFLQAISKAQTQKNLTALKTRLDNLSDKDSVTVQDALFVKSSGKVMRIKLEDIMFIEARKEYVSIVTAKDEKILTLSGIGQMEVILAPYGFVRVHKSYLVPISMIEEIEHNTIKIMKQTIPIAANYRETFLNAIQKNAIYLQQRLKK